MLNVELLTNGRRNPVGVQPDCVKFSWKYPVEVARFQQEAYRIQVSTKKQMLENGTPDLWDSGWVVSGNNLNIPSAIAQCPAMKPIYWTVCLRDAEGAEYIMEPAYFVVQPRRWKAKWIWKNHEICVNDIAGFKKEFTLEEHVDYAYLCVSAHSQYKIWVNGCQVGGYVSPAPTTPKNDKRFLGFDVSHYLRSGKNLIEAVAIYQGGSGQNFVDGKPGFFCEVHIQSGRKRVCIVTGDDWLSTGETPYESGMPYQQNRRITAVEHYDNRKTAQWTPAVCVTGPCAVNTLRLQSIPEGVVERVITPRCLHQENGLIIYDAGCIISGWVKLKLSETCGTRICVRYSENLNGDGRVGHNVANETSDNYCDYYTVGNDGTEAWSPCFSYKAFRYFEITGHHNPVEVLVEDAHTDIHQVGEFYCDNPLLNQIFDACIQTQKNNALGQLVDCPHREQAQYLADSDVQAESLLYNFDAATVAEKVLSDFASAQQKDGTFPFVYPSNYRHKDFTIRIPEWDLHFCTLLWKLYFLTGNVDYLRRYYAPCQAMVDHYLALRSEENGLVPQSKHWHISDWPYPDVDHSGKYLAAENIKIYHDVSLMRKMAGILGLEEDAQRYEAVENKYRSDIRNHLLDAQRGLFRDSSDSAHFATGVNALALCYGLFESDEFERAVSHLENTPWESSTLLTLNVLQALLANGRTEAAYRMLTADKDRGWGVMIKKGYGTMWEGFSDIESHSHAWNAYPARIFAEYLVGIRCAEAGFARVELKPCFPAELNHLSATVNTPQGILSAKWDRSEFGITLNLNVPYGVHVDVYLPADNGTYSFVKTVSAGHHVITM